MSEHIQPVSLTPVPKPHKGLKRWLLFGGIILLVLFLLLLYLFRSTTLLDGVLRSIRYLGHADSAITYDLSGLQSSTLVGHSLTVCDQSGVTLFDSDGAQRGTLKRNLYTPVLQSTSGQLLLYDVGGSTLVLLDETANVLSEPDLTGLILDASLSQSGRYAVLCSSDAANSVLDVYLEDGTLLFRRTAKSHYLNACALSPGGSYVAAVLMDQQEVSFTSVIQLFRTDTQDPIAEVPTKQGLVFALRFVDDRTLCAFGLYGLTFLSLDGNIVSEYPYPDAALLSYSVADGHVALALDTYDLSDRYHLVVLDADGQERAVQTLAEAADMTSLCKRYIAVLSDTQVQIFTTALAPVATIQTGGSCAAVHVQRDGTAYLVSEQSATLLIPE